MESGQGIHSVNIPGTFKPVANKSNDYLIARQAQKDRKTFSGVSGSAQQDAACQEAMGAIQDRSRERLGTSDAGIIAARERLLHAAIALRDHGTTPPDLMRLAQPALAVMPLQARVLEQLSDGRLGGAGASASV